MPYNHKHACVTYIQHRSRNPSFATVSTDNVFVTISSTKGFSHHRKCKGKIGRKYTKLKYKREETGP